MNRLIPPPPKDIRECQLYKALQAKSTVEDGLAAKVEQFIVTATPFLELIIAGPFKEYTLHNPDHAKKLVHIADHLIDKSTLDQLSAVECSVIIYSAFLHDMGMCLTSTERERIIKSEDFRESLRGWQELSEALEVARQRIKTASDPEKPTIETHIFQLLEAGLASYLRPRHATTDRYRELLQAIENKAGRRDMFAVREVSFRDALIDVCVSHNLDVGVLAEVMGPYDDRYPRALPIVGQRLNTQFCAAVLRVVDILDFDRERTPAVLFESLGIAFRAIPGAEVSLREWQKHMAVHALEIAGEELIVSADSTHPAIESAIREFCKIIERELRETMAVLKRNSSDIFARYNLDLPVNVRPRIKSIRYVFKDMSLRLNEAAIMNLLMGEKLYLHPGVALRELIQNAIDACRVRVQTDGSHYTPAIKINLNTDDMDRRWLEILDNGIGMDEYVVSEYFLRVGTSYYESPEFKRILRQASAIEFVPISRFGIGVLAVFMIADAVEVVTKNPRSPRGDTKQRMVRIESKRGLAFVTENPGGEQGTCVRIRLKREYESDQALSGILHYIKSVLVRPEWPISFDAGRFTFLLRAQPYFTVREEERKRLSKRDIEVFLIDLQRWSDRISGVAGLIFARMEDGRLSHRRNGKRLGFGTSSTRVYEDIDPASLFERYPGNRVTVNGFMMALKRASRIFGTIKTGIGVIFDVDVRGDAAVTYDVSRSRITGLGSAVVRQDLREAIVKGLREQSVFDRLVPETQEVFLEALTQGTISSSQPYVDVFQPQLQGRSTTEILADKDLIDRVVAMLPSSGKWPRFIHKTIALELGISNGSATRILSALLEEGRVRKPVDSASGFES
jgi:molecular chaperone HtpG